ncbi:hypothetical protein [Eleftheria terrae]|uniref:hypothetical protein n=1 Tax=Eleftheria terrae TaxID=1597781 RepID=UPI00263A6A7E|nr:hypothetical protein [Eleftheria terrae]WKB54994.1 hypothetical protein N7L95_11720 [Eleftheria terrae]
MANTLKDHRGIALVLCLLGAAASATPTAQAPMAPAADAPAEGPADAQALSRSYLALRKAPGHFNGGRWNAEVDGWGGRKQRVMEQLAAEVLGRPTTAAGLRRLMQQPDEVTACPSAGCSTIVSGLREGGESSATSMAPAGWGREAVGSALKQTTGASLWIYDWRGRHDRLVFVVAGDQVQAGGWLYAGE